MNPIDVIALCYEKFTKNEKKIADLILSDPKGFMRNDLVTILKKLNVSKSAMIRFSKKIGYSGYQEYLYDLRRFIMRGNDSGVNEDIVKSVCNAYIKGVEELKSSFSVDKFSDLVDLILKSRNVYSLGFNRTALSAKHLSLRALSLQVGITAVINDFTEIKDIVRLATKDDLFIIMTCSDNTHYFEEMKDILLNCNYVVVTFNPHLEILDHSKYNFILPSNFKTYGTFYDEQAIFFVWIEILIHMIDKKE